MTREDVTTGNRVCAVRVMGYWDSTPMDVIRVSFDPKAPDFRIGDEGDIFVHRGGYLYLPFSPMTEPYDCAAVKARMHGLGWSWMAKTSGGGFAAEFHQNTATNFIVYRAEADTEESAVTMAANTAMGWGL